MRRPVGWIAKARGARLNLLHQHPVPDVVRIDGERVFPGLVRRVEETRQAGEAVEIDLDEIGYAVRDQTLLAVPGYELIVLAAAFELQQLEDSPDGERLFKKIGLLWEEVEPEHRLVRQREVLPEMPVIRRVAGREAERIGRRLRLDVVHA